MNNKSNPLSAEPKREKKGSETYSKYNYQYHWAFCRILDEHKNGSDYAVFVEEHEDVTLATSLEVEHAKFELNQVKCTAKKHTITSLTSESAGTPLLRKLAQSAAGKSFTSQLKSVRFVSSGGYGFKLHEEGFKFDVIDSGKLKQSEAEKVKECLEAEPGGGELFDLLVFVVPDLPDTDFDNAVEGRISKMINEMAPGSKYNSSVIYECILRDLQRKGENQFDYPNWDDALKKKAVTSKQVSDIFSKHISLKPEESIKIELFQILKDDYELGTLQRRNVSSFFDKYHIRRLTDRDAGIESIAVELSELIDKHKGDCQNAKALEEAIKESASDSLLEYFQLSEHFTGAFLYELVVSPE